MIKYFSLIAISFFISTSCLAAKKAKKNRTLTSPTSLSEKALTEVNEPVILKNPASAASDNSGVLNVKTTPLSNEINYRSFPVGLSLSYLNTKGILKNKKNSQLDLAQNQSPILVNLVLNYNQPMERFLSNMALNLGYQQSRQIVTSLESVLVSKSSLHLSAYKKLYQVGLVNLAALGELGFLQVHVTNSENGLLNTYDKTNFIGFGGSATRDLNSQLRINTELAYRKVILSSSEVQLEPFIFTVGAAYLW